MLIEEAKYGTYKNKRICKRDPNFKLKWWELAIPFWNLHKVTQCASKCNWFCPAGSAKTIVKNYKDKCDGQHACELLPTNEMQGDPCKKDKYAYVRYTCLKDGDLKQLRPYTKSLLVHAPKVEGKFQGDALVHPARIERIWDTRGLGKVRSEDAFKKIKSDGIYEQVFAGVFSRV